MSTNEPTEPISRRYVFHGRVQGVGFRFTTTAIARRFPVAGYVKNLPDGTVELVVSATEAVLDAMIDEIRAAFPGHIDECRCEQRPAGSNSTGFEVRY